MDPKKVDVNISLFGVDKKSLRFVFLQCFGNGKAFSANIFNEEVLKDNTAFHIMIDILLSNNSMFQVYANVLRAHNITLKWNSPSIYHSNNSIINTSISDRNDCNRNYTFNKEKI